MTIEEFERRAMYQGGYDRRIDNWKIIDIHMIPDPLGVGGEFDFYCSDDKFVSLLRICVCSSQKKEQYSSIDDKYNDITYFIAELHIDRIDDDLILSLLSKFIKK